MASLFTNGKFQAENAAGPVPGAKLYSYAAGTTTPLATYTDQGGLSPNTNPVICNAAGQASVWLGSAAYRMILKDASDVTIWDVDNIDAGGSASALAASGGSSLVGFIQAGTGAVARTLQAKARDIALNVKDFGAVGDGVTDDSAAFAAAIRAAMVFFNGASFFAAPLYIPAGNYLVTTNNFLGLLDFTTLPGAFTARWGFTMFGDGWASNIIWRPTSVGTAVWMYDNGSAAQANNTLSFPTFRDFQITHDTTNLSGGATINGFRCYGAGSTNGVCQNFSFERMRFAILNYGNAIPTATRAKCGTFMELKGTINCSENNWNACEIQAWGTVLITDNINAVDHGFINTNCEEIFGDVFVVKQGSEITVEGGSWILESEATSYFLALRQAATALNGSILIKGARLELRVNSLSTYLSNVLLTTATGVPAAYQSSFPVINFSGCSFNTTLGTARNTFVIDAALPAKITVDGCAMDVAGTQVHQVSVNSSKTGLQTANTAWWMAELAFVNGDAVPFGSVTFTDTNSTAKISARGCLNSIDYDLMANGVGDQATGRSRPLKSATLWGTSWPDTGNNATMRLKLPKGSLLKKAMFRKAANGGTATAGYQLAMADPSANLYCSSTIAVQNIEHKALADNINMLLDDALGYVAGISAAQDVFLIATAGHLGSAQAVALAKTDYAVVDYY